MSKSLLLLMLLFISLLFPSSWYNFWGLNILRFLILMWTIAVYLLSTCPLIDHKITLIFLTYWNTCITHYDWHWLKYILSFNMPSKRKYLVKQLFSFRKYIIFIRVQEKISSNKNNLWSWWKWYNFTKNKFQIIRISQQVPTILWVGSNAYLSEIQRGNSFLGHWHLILFDAC